MNKIADIKTLTHQEEIELLRQAKEGKSRQEREKATRLLVYYNRSFVKYLVGGYYYLQNEINSEDLVTEGSIALLQAIREFDLSKAKEYRLASYAGYWIHQRIRSFVKKSQLLPQTTQKKPNFSEEEEDDLLENQKKVPHKKSWGVIYYDKDYHGTEKDDKATSLLDTLADNSEQIEQQIHHEETKLKVNELILQLEYHEELIIRLFFGVAPVNMAQISRLATEERVKELKKIKFKRKKDNFSSEKKNHPLLEKYHEILAVPRKKEEIIQEFMQPEFWRYFREFPELALKTESSRRTSAKKLAETNQATDSAEQKKWKSESLSEQQILRWISLGYQPEEAFDPQIQLLQKLGVSKKEKEQWEKSSSKTKSKNWLEQRLGKVIDNRKKNILEKLKQISEGK